MASETELITEAQKGNHSAFETLVYRYDKNVLSMALKYTADEDTARDIYQDVFIRVYKGLKNFRFDSEFSTWLYRIATNVCLSYKAKEKKHVLVSINEENDESEPMLEIADDISPSPEEGAHNSEVSESINEALLELSEKQRMTFVLKHYEGFKIREIAEMLQCKEGTVKKYLFEAVHKLRVKLNKYKV